MTWSRQLNLMDAPTRLPTWIPDPDGQHGEVFTRRWVVELILDLVGYQVDDDLGSKVIIEPSCGSGAFLIPMVERLAKSCRIHGRSLADMADAIHAFDLLEHNAELARKAVMAYLLEIGETFDVAERLSGQWVVTGDFLLTDHRSLMADFVVGNPPYIRLEDIPTEVSDAYRAACSAMRGRADIYVGFYERGLGLLKDEGRLAFICADRWMRNQYGSRLRQFVSDDFAVDSVIVMHDVDAFEDDVSAYPAITVLRNGDQRASRVIEAKADFDADAGKQVLSWVRSKNQPTPESDAFEAVELPTWFEGQALWPSGSPLQLELVADLERRFPPLEDSKTRTRVGIGVASGCDDVYIRSDAPDVEPDRLLPLVMANDIRGGTIEWSGQHLVNPWRDGKLVDRGEFPQLTGYLERNSSRVKGRHVARKRPDSWHRTIDRVDPDLQSKPKLLLPDMKAAAHPVLDTGQFYPHHNLYYVVSDVWDLEVLGGLLLSDIANLFVGAYCVKMRGGTYRFQAQYLRKIRVPAPDSLSKATATALTKAFRNRDRKAATKAAMKAYGIPAGSI